MGTAFGQATDYLFSGTITKTTSPLFGQTLLTQLLTAAETVILADNYYTPSADIGGDYVVAIGRSALDAAKATSSRVYLELGQFNVDEQFAVPVLILARGNGPEPKPTRDTALALFDQLAHFVQQDLSLGGALLGGRYATIPGYEITQTETGDDSANAGMQTVTITTSVTAKNHYQP
jgi:hypothetical protein